jgi:dihydrolipoamide dehydrogenase
MPTPVTLPDLGLEPEQTVGVSAWFAAPGDVVFEGDRLVEVLTLGATFDVPAPANGRLSAIIAYPDDPVHSGQVLGWIDDADDALSEPKHD